MDRSRSPRPDRERYGRSPGRDDYEGLNSESRYRDTQRRRRRRSRSDSRSPRPSRRSGRYNDKQRISLSPRRSRSPRDRRKRNNKDDDDDDDDKHNRHSKSYRRNHKHRSRSEDGKRDRDRNRDHEAERSSTSAIERRSRMPLPSQQSAFRGQDIDGDKEVAVEKLKPNFGASGKLAAETNTVAGTNVVLKYNEPPEARKPPASQQWRLYVFKGKETLDTIELYSRSCWLFGRERIVVDYPVEHPSCSKQHAVMQFRYLEKTNEYGDKLGSVKPYLIDLESANGTKVNGDTIPDRRYIELRSGDVVTFGESLRDYVLMLPR